MMTTHAARWWTRAFICAIAAWVGLATRADAGGVAPVPPPIVLDDPQSSSTSEGREIESALAAWDLPTARRALADAPAGPRTLVKQGVLAVYEAHYAEAEELLASALASDELGEGDVGEASHYLALARGARKALGNPTTIRSADGMVEVVFADAKDALLAPYLFDAMATAREVIGRELGVRPSEAVRFEFFDDPAKLAMVTPLTIENVRTTGTVGVTKYRRIMMITPRAMVYGYGWLDTVVHEYVHYVLTMRTRNLAPVWLQEGLAKLFETRWRRDRADELDHGVAFRLHQAIVKDDLVTFSEMYPSVAMLPSAERAALAYAEVETMLGLLHERRGGAGIDLLLDRVAAGDDAEAALATAWGAEFDDFMAEWKRVMRGRTRGAANEDIDAPVFKDSAEAAAEAAAALGDVFSHLGGGKARQHARLGSLLQARDHLSAAAIQYEKARAADPRARKDPELARRAGRLYVELAAYDRAVPLLDVAARRNPDDANLAAAQGRARLRSADPRGAAEALARAVRVNPFIPSIHCDLAELATDSTRQAQEKALCPE